MARTQYVRETKIREKRIINDDEEEDRDSPLSTTMIVAVMFLTHCLYLLTIINQAQTNFERIKNNTMI